MHYKTASEVRRFADKTASKCLHKCAKLVSTTVKVGPTETTHTWKRGYAPEALGAVGLLAGGVGGYILSDPKDSDLKRLAKVIAGSVIGGLAGYSGGWGLTELARKDLQA